MANNKKAIVNYKKSIIHKYHRKIQYKSANQSWIDQHVQEK